MAREGCLWGWRWEEGGEKSKVFQCSEEQKCKIPRIETTSYFLGMMDQLSFSRPSPPVGFGKMPLGESVERALPDDERTTLWLFVFALTTWSQKYCPP